ncbi:MAG: ArsA-related P-loop ATPase [Myxococcota bacterium]
MILVTGKGGVGRTTVAAALAIAGVHAGRRVLLTEIGEPGGDYSPLARIFGRETFMVEPEEVGHGVKACVLYSRQGHELFLRSVLPIRTLIRAAMRSKALSRFLDSAPSFSEMGVFYHLLTLLRAETDEGEIEHELIVVDMPATGHTLALTSLPGTLLQLIPVGPVADELRVGQDYLNNPETGAALVVTLPEPLPVTECLELIDGLRETDMPVGGVLVNKVMRDLFTPEERAALMPIVQSRPVFGRSRFLGLLDNNRAVRRLYNNTDVSIALAPEVTSDDALVENLAASLLKSIG